MQFCADSPCLRESVFPCARGKDSRDVVYLRFIFCITFVICGNGEYLIFFNLFIPAVFTEQYIKGIGQSQKHSSIVAECPTFIDLLYSITHTL
jgi:hypothetical protein